jgi:hypothetical protein
LSLSGGDREFESCFFQRRICLSWDFIFVVNNPGFPRGEPGKESGRLPGNYQIGGYRRNRRQRLILPAPGGEVPLDQSGALCRHTLHL